MVYNYNRFLVGIVIIFAISVSYFFDLDLFFYFTVSILTLYELYNSLLKNKYKLIILFLLTIFQFFFFFNLANNYIFIIAASLFFLLSSIIFKKFFNIFFVLFVINIIILISYLYSIDRNIIYTIILISFVNDTIAYIVGSFIKGPLILPRISPKKTWSGTSSSFIITTILLILLDYNFLLAPLMAISLFIGDIYFSYIKRKLSIKDFSNLLSSHGGILDRLDSISFLILIYGISNLLL